MQTYFMQAQAEAARLGRPVGVGFRETGSNSGVALEAFQMVVPPAYPGSSSLSRVAVKAMPIDPTTGLPDPSKPPELYAGTEAGIRFPAYLDARLYAVQTQLAVPIGGNNEDSLPSNMFQLGDIIEAEGNRFVIVDDRRNLKMREFPNGVWFLNPAERTDEFKNTLVCVRLEEVQQGTKVPPLPQQVSIFTYGIHRQPIGAERTAGSPKERIITSVESPFPLPAGVVIDMQASGAEGSDGGLFASTYPDSTKIVPTIAGVMFSPNGGIDSVWVNGNRLTSVSRVFFLLGRVENGNPPQELYMDWGDNKRLSDDEFRDRQDKVNWLNPDSRWLMINGNDGRLAVSQNAFVDPRGVDFQDDTRDYVTAGMQSLDQTQINNLGGDDYARAMLTKAFQIEAAHELAHGGHSEEH